MKYEVVLLPKAKRAFGALPAEAKGRIGRALDRLEADPRPSGVKKLGGAPLWRIRVGEYRIIFSISDRERLAVIEQILRRTTTTYD